jgi:membrane protease YdiL (CAAX protease family)
MNNHLNLSTHQKILFMGLIFVVIVLELFDFSFLGAEKDVDMMTGTITRIAAGILFMILLFGLNYKEIFKFKHTMKSLIIMIPAFIISINNFPIVAFFDGRATLSDPIYRIFLFLLECLSVGFFEEILFRGIILLFFIQRLEKVKYGTLYAIFISSMLFGMLHIINLFDGAGFGDTMLQVGYSFLVGMMWAVMFLRTKNLWLTMLLHASFNFFGQVMFYLGVVNGRYDIYTIIITITLGVLVALYAIKLLKDINLENHI